MEISDLSGDQRRQLIDAQQLFGALREADVEYRRRFEGSMRWVQREDTGYLLRKIGPSERSLGPRTDRTEAAFRAFVEGKTAADERRRNLRRRLEELAPINRAMGLGRVPAITGRILRSLDREGLLGEQIVVVGTNSLFAYEAAAGVRLSSDLVATADIDFLLDARRRLSLAVHKVREQGLIGLLKKVDRTFTVSRNRYRAANSEGYVVELIRPEPKDVLRDRSSGTLTDLPDDLEGAPLIGLDWLISAPKMTAVAIDASGLPLRLVVIDPRAFALHKLWLSKRVDREPVKKQRDLDQAKAAARIATVHLGLSFEGDGVHSLPRALREDVGPLVDGANEPEPPPW
jgi:hypothetical protein